jgi:hypothetical protein
MSISWGTNTGKLNFLFPLQQGKGEPAVDWSQVDVIKHRNAFTRAKAEFFEAHEYAPTTSAELSSVMRRAEAIRKREI